MGGEAAFTEDNPSSGFFASPTILHAGRLQSADPSNPQISSHPSLPSSADSIQTFASNQIEADFPILILRHFTTVQELVSFTDSILNFSHLSCIICGCSLSINLKLNLYLTDIFSLRPASVSIWSHVVHIYKKGLPAIGKETATIGIITHSAQVTDPLVIVYL